MLTEIGRWWIAAALLSLGGVLAQEPAGISDGPFLFHEKDGAVTARWIADGKVHAKKFAKGQPVVLKRFRDLIGESYSIRPHRVSKPLLKAPKKLIAISDVEGQFDRLVTFCRMNGITNAKNEWKWGKGHLVCVGDFVDRGTKVTETLWFLMRLEREAEAAGGQVHFLIGNHEAMVMKGDVRYSAPKYVEGARLLGSTDGKHYPANTELGRWLRTRNTIIRIGDMIFVHAGVSPELVARDLSFREINDGIRGALGKGSKDIEDAQSRWLSSSRMGPLWYRGYFERHAKSFGPRPDLKTIDQMLRKLAAKTIVIGHTKVRKVEAIYPASRVIDIDTTWTSHDKVRGLLLRDGRLHVTNLKGLARLWPRAN